MGSSGKHEMVCYLQHARHVLPNTTQIMENETFIFFRTYYIFIGFMYIVSLYDDFFTRFFILTWFWVSYIFEENWEDSCVGIKFFPNSNWKILLPVKNYNMWRKMFWIWICVFFDTFSKKNFANRTKKLWWMGTLDIILFFSSYLMNYFERKKLF